MLRLDWGSRSASGGGWVGMSMFGREMGDACRAEAGSAGSMSGEGWSSSSDEA